MASLQRVAIYDVPKMTGVLRYRALLYGGPVLASGLGSFVVDR